MFRCLKSRFTRCQRRFLFICLITILTFIYVHHQSVIHEKIHQINDSRVINEIYPDRRSKSRNFRRNNRVQEVLEDADFELEEKPVKLADFDANLGQELEALADKKSPPQAIPKSDEVNDLDNLPKNSDLFPPIKLGLAGTWHDSAIPHTPIQEEIKAEFLYAWKAYSNYAWGYDTLKPLSKSSETWFDMGLTILDSLDNLIIFGLTEEYEKAKNWVEHSLNFDKNIDYVNLFECTIRVLGGLLSAHTLSAEPVFLDKAVDIGERLLNAWSQSKTEIPLSDINPYTRKSRPPRWGSDSSTSEVTTVQLEFRELAMLTNDPKFTIPARKTSRLLSKLTNQQFDSHSKPHHFVSMMVNPHTGRMSDSGTITFGARTDSYYEYLLKQWIQSNGDPKDEWLFNDYLAAMEDLKTHLIQTTHGSEKLTFVAELKNNRVHPKMDHLVCFLPGTLALGYFFSQQSTVSHQKVPEWHLELAEELARTCFYFYKSFETGLPPEIVYFNLDDGSKQEIYVKPLDAFSLLRPESIESWFYLYRITQKDIYRDYGKFYLEALKKYAKVDQNRGYASLDNVNLKSSRQRDKMESFFMAETLKYLFLLFSDDPSLLPLDKFVFNTEAHPLLIRNTGHDIMFSE